MSSFVTLLKKIFVPKHIVYVMYFIHVFVENRKQFNKTAFVDELIKNYT